MPFIVLILLSALLVGCTSPGAALSTADVAAIEENVTTRAEIEKWFGRPGSTSTGPDQKTVAEYWFNISTKTVDGRRLARSRRLSLIYDELGTVEKFLHYEWNGRIYETRGGSWMGTPFGKTGWIRKGRTTFEEITKAYGLPYSKGLKADGTLVAVWVYDQSNVTEVGTSQEFLWVHLDDLGVVSDFTQNQIRPW